MRKIFINLQNLYTIYDRRPLRRSLGPRWWYMINAALNYVLNLFARPGDDAGSGHHPSSSFRPHAEDVQCKYMR